MGFVSFARQDMITRINAISGGNFTMKNVIYYFAVPRNACSFFNKN